MGEMSWVELMGRHTASATVYVSGSLRYRDGAGEWGGVFEFRHGPGQRWHISDEDQRVVYTQDGDGVTHTRDDGALVRVDADMILPLTYAAIRPFDVIGPRSLLYRMTASKRILTSPFEVVHDGRPAWTTVFEAYGKQGEVTIDAATGVVVQMSSNALVALEVIGLTEHTVLPESAFTPGDDDAAPRPRTITAPTSAEIVAAAQPRLELLDAIATAVEHRDQLLELIATAPTPGHARTALGKRFGISDVGADAVLGMQLRRLTTGERAKIVAERDEVRQEILDNER